MNWKIVVEQRHHEPRCPVCNAPNENIKTAISALYLADTVFRCGVCYSVLMREGSDE